MIFQKAQQNVCKKLNIDYTSVSAGLNGLFAIDDIQDALNDAILQVWDYKPWAMKEGDKKIVTIDTDYYDYPTEYRPGSINFLTVAGKEYTKLTWEAYRKHFEDNPDSMDKVWCERKRYVFINKNAHEIGDEIVMFGRLRVLKLSEDADLMPFSPDSTDQDSSGNESICQLAYGNILSSEKKKMYNEGKNEITKAYSKLELLWKEESALKATEKSAGRPFMNVPDFFSNNGRGNPTKNYGNFNY